MLVSCCATQHGAGYYTAQFIYTESFGRHMHCACGTTVGLPVRTYSDDDDFHCRYRADQPCPCSGSWCAPSLRRRGLGCFRCVGGSSAPPPNGDDTLGMGEKIAVYTAGQPSPPAPIRSPCKHVCMTSFNKPVVYDEYNSF